jgi:hypothetical protein
MPPFIVHTTLSLNQSSKDMKNNYEEGHLQSPSSLNDVTPNHEEDCGCDIHDYCSHHNPDNIEVKEKITPNNFNHQ